MIVAIGGGKNAGLLAVQILAASDPRLLGRIMNFKSSLATEPAAGVCAPNRTLFPVEGDGSRGKRPADIPEFANIQIEVIVPQAVAEQLLEKLARDLFPRYGMVAFESDVRVLRPQKF